MFTKILTWLRMNGASILAAAQLLVKAVKETITAVINVLSLIIPSMAAESIILKVRAVCESIDAWIEKIKAWLLVVVNV